MLAFRHSPQRLAMALCAAFLIVAAAQTAPAQTPWLDQDVIWPAEAQEPSPSQPPPATENAPPVALATIHGVVRNAATGQPLPRALVRIEGEAGAGALTDSEGRFEIPGVPVGPQTVQVRKPGFHDRPYASEDVDYQADGPAHTVLVAAEMPDLNFALTPASVIHGRIELSTGDPAEGITVALLKQVIRNGRAIWAQNETTKTNGAGAYRFAGLPAGVYALFTRPAWENEQATTARAAEAKVVRYGYPSIFYPEAREFSGAAHIRLAAGEQAEANLLLKLEPFYTVTARAILPNGKPYEGKDFANNLPSIFVAGYVLDITGRDLAYATRYDEAAHTFQTSLPDGTYTFWVGVTSVGSRASGRGSLASEAGEDFFGFAEFSVDGHTVTNLPIPFAPLPSWPIHLRAVRTVPLPAESWGSIMGLHRLVSVSGTHAGDPNMNGISGDATSDDAGPDLLEIFGLGSLWISTQVGDRSLCVDSFTAGGINLAREPLNVPLGSSPPPMELTLRDDCAKLTLELPPALSAFLPGDEPFYTVYIVPDFDTTVDIPPMNMHPSSGATLTVDGLTPGSYHVYTFDRPVRLEYRNPAALAALPTPGQQVTLTAGTTSSLMLEVPGR